MAAAPAYASTPQTAVVNISAANTNRDGSGTITTLITGAATGTRVDDIEITSAVVTNCSNGVIRLFLHDGTNARLLREVLVVATTPSTTVETWHTKLLGLGIILKNASWSLRVSTHVAESFNVAVTSAGDF